MTNSQYQLFYVLCLASCGSADALGGCDISLGLGKRKLKPGDGWGSLPIPRTFTTTTASTGYFYPRPASRLANAFFISYFASFPPPPPFPQTPPLSTSQCSLSFFPPMFLLISTTTSTPHFQLSFLLLVSPSPHFFELAYVLLIPLIIITPPRLHLQPCRTFFPLNSLSQTFRNSSRLDLFVLILLLSLARQSSLFTWLLLSITERKDHARGLLQRMICSAAGDRPRGRIRKVEPRSATHMNVGGFSDSTKQNKKTCYTTKLLISESRNKRRKYSDASLKFQFSFFGSSLSASCPPGTRRDCRMMIQLLYLM